MCFGRRYVAETIRRQIDITTYQLLFFLSDTSLCLFGDELFDASPIAELLMSKLPIFSVAKITVI